MRTVFFVPLAAWQFKYNVRTKMDACEIGTARSAQSKNALLIRRWYHWHEPGTSKAEKRLVRKLDFFILLYTCLVCLPISLTVYWHGLTLYHADILHQVSCKMPNNSRTACHWFMFLTGAIGSRKFANSVLCPHEGRSALEYAMPLIRITTAKLIIPRSGWLELVHYLL